MGKMAYSGPVYGAKTLLWCFGPYTDAHSTGATTGLLVTNATRTVPPYEDWFITEGQVLNSTNSSVTSGHAIYIKTEGGSSGLSPRQNGQGTTNAATIMSFVFPTANSTAAHNLTTSAAVTAGEYEGTWCPAGSSIRIVTSGVTVAGLVQVNLWGFIRFVDSTRAS